MRYSLSRSKRIRTLSDRPTVFLTFVVCLLCWVTGYYYSIGFPLSEYSAVLPLWGLLCKLLNNALVIYPVGFILIVLIAFVIQRICDRDMLSPERTRLPFLLFILLFSTNSELFPFSEVSVVLLCLVIIIYELFDSYQSPEATGKFFNIGVLIGVSGLLLPQVLWIIPLLWIVMYQFRSLSLKGFASSLTGILIIYWFVLAWCVWKHDFSMFSSLFSSITDFEIISTTTLFQSYRISIAVVIFLLIPAFLHIKTVASSNSVRVRMMLSFLLNMSAWSLVLIFLYGKNTDSFFAIMYLSVSILATYFFYNMRNNIRFVFYYSMLVLLFFSFIIHVWSY